MILIDHIYQNAYFKVVTLIPLSGFKTPAGVFAVSGLHVLPVWLYGLKSHLWTPFMSHHLQMGVTGVLVSGRALCMAVEVSVVTCCSNQNEKTS